MEIVKSKHGVIRYKEKIYLSNGFTQTKTFDRKVDAKAWKQLKRIERARNESLGISSLKENLLFDEIFELWMKMKIRPIRSAKTVADYLSIGRKHLRSNFSTIPIRSFEHSHCDYLVEKMKSAGLVNKTANKVLSLLKQILKFAEVHGYIRISPLRNFPMLPETVGRLDFLTRQEILQLLRSNSNEEIYPILVLALNTGMRIGELTGLCWDRVNLESGTIEVSRAMTRSGLKESTKTNLIRHIPMNPEVRDTLRTLLRLQRSLRFVFVNSRGHPFNPDHFSKRHLQSALIRANVRPISFHLLRHTYASTFMMNGGNIFDLQKILGHTKVDMTMIYAHLSPQHLSSIIGTVRYSAEGDKSDSPFLALQNLRKDSGTA